jgi:peptidoglycan/LPS O-acetylase OafA/YrhL
VVRPALVAYDLITEMFVRRLVPTGYLPNPLLTIVGTVAVAYVFYLYVERPFMSFGYQDAGQGHAGATGLGQTGGVIERLRSRLQEQEEH